MATLPKDLEDKLRREGRIPGGDPGVTVLGENVPRDPEGAGKGPSTGLRKMQALGRLKAEEMNRTEADYAAHLELLKVSGKIQWFMFHAVRLRIAPSTFYVPDFLVLLDDGRLRIDEVKGFWTDDARVKMKVAASIFPFIFMAVYKLPKSKGGGYKFEYI